jgi:hypothetical protein
MALLRCLRWSSGVASEGAQVNVVEACWWCQPSGAAPHIYSHYIYSHALSTLVVVYMFSVVGFVYFLFSHSYSHALFNHCRPHIPLSLLRARSLSPSLSAPLPPSGSTGFRTLHI